jgi:sterol desaturase/sphingolipid hydroxylase (fatty acid hydroxylase superfamily)
VHSPYSAAYTTTTAEPLDARTALVATTVDPTPVVRNADEWNATGMGTVELAWSLLVGISGQVLRPQSSIYWIYLASALVLTVGTFALGAGRHNSGFAALVGYCFPRRIWTHASTRHDAALFVVNAAAYTLWLLGPIQVISRTTASCVRAGLAAVMQPHDALGGLEGRAVAAVAAFVAADFAFFLSHWAMHRVGWLWHFHKVHHSARVLTPLTVFRRHPVDVVLERGLTACFVGAVYGAVAFFSGGFVEPLAVLGQNAVVFGLLLVGFNLQHSHVWLRFGPLEAVLVSPAMHQVHHSRSRLHHDKNFGNMLSFWDRLAGTQYRPMRRERLRFGLGPEEARAHRSLAALYLEPFADLARDAARAAGRKAPRPPRLRPSPERRRSRTLS